MITEGIQQLIDDTFSQRPQLYGLDADAVICDFIEAYCSLSRENRSTLYGKLTARQQEKLRAFAGWMSVLAVRENDSIRIAQGALALAIAGFRQDPREDLLLVRTLLHSAQELSLDAHPLFEQAAQVARGDVALLLRELVSCAPSLENLGFQEGVDEDGLFTYCFAPL